MRTWSLLLATPLVVAAAPPQGFTLAVPPSYPFTAVAPTPAPTRPRTPGPVYEPAPLPNRNIGPPSRVESDGPEISPSLFNRRDQFRGDSFGKGDSEQSTQDRNLKPSPGFRLRMPLVPGEPQ